MGSINRGTGPHRVRCVASSFFAGKRFCFRPPNCSKGYWCHIISPVFFGRSVRSRRVTKREARRRRREAGTSQLEENIAIRIVSANDNDITGGRGDGSAQGKESPQQSIPEGGFHHEKTRFSILRGHCSPACSSSALELRKMPWTDLPRHSTSKRGWLLSHAPLVRTTD